MPGRLARATVRRRAASEPTTVRLAVYHASEDVESHVAALRRAHFRVRLFPQRDINGDRRATRAYDAVLWELRTTRGGRRRRPRIARDVPAVSYSVQGGRELAELSRSLGFAFHLQAPLQPIELQHRLALAAGLDLATRVRRFEATLRRHLGRVGTLAEFMRGVNSALEAGRIADYVSTRLAEWLPVRAWGVVTTDEAGELRVLGASGLAASEYGAVEQVATWAIRTGSDYMAANLQHDRSLTDVPAVAAAVFTLPCRGRTVGAAVGLDTRASSDEPRLGTPTIRLFQSYLEAAALALDNALRLQRIEALSVTDDLTQLYNSRYLTQVLRRETKRASRSGHPLSLLFLDLDGFKAINDAHGHLLGSRALIEAADVMRRTARETDVVARFGGDEFAIVLPETGTEGALAVGERVRARIAEHPFLASEGLDIRLSASVGVATLPNAADSVEALVAAADRAMYWVKDRGKNGIRVAVQD